MEKIQLAVNGTLMRGLELNQNLLDVGAQFVREAATAPVYRLWSINDRYPGMLRDPQQGSAIQLEIWEMTSEALVAVLSQEPPGLCIGFIELEDGARLPGVLAEPYICAGQQEITAHGGWRAYRRATA